MFNADVPEEDIVGAIQRLEEKYQAEEFSFQLFRTGGGYQFLTKPAYQTSIGILLKQQSKKRLSTSAMETLSIIAYKQPISKTEIENIRGVNCDYAVQKLLDKSLIEITGKAETIGRPMLYGTTPKFMEYFGINDLAELPVPKEATTDVNTIGINTESPDAEVQLDDAGLATELVDLSESAEETLTVDVAGADELLESPTSNALEAESKLTDSEYAETEPAAELSAEEGPSEEQDAGSDDAGASSNTEKESDAQF